MCGIAGIISSPSTQPAPSCIAKALKALDHRGPDDRGYLTFGSGRTITGKDWPAAPGPWQVALFHRRLSILDLSEAGWQPMSTPDGRYHIVFNGEIYNYLEIRRELEALGHRFVSTSDTEVLLAGFVRWGTRVLSRLVGMFAFAVLDVEKRKLTLVRDFFGIKPLYYTRACGFAFASEIPALLELPGVSRRAQPGQLYLYLRHGLTDNGERTLFDDILRLPPAHFLEIDIDAPEKARPAAYWHPTREKVSDISFSEATDRMRELFLQSVDWHLRSDVPVGAALSGGIDSSAIVMAMRRLKGSNLSLHTFSFIAPEPRINEEKWVDTVVSSAGAMAHKVHPVAEELVTDLDNLIAVQGEPFGSTSIYAQYRVFKSAREAGIKVMLDGQGADEILGGYRPLVSARLASLVRQGRVAQAASLLFHGAGLPGSNLAGTVAMTASYLLPRRLQSVVRPWIGKELVPSWMNAEWFAERECPALGLQYTRERNVLSEAMHRALSENSIPNLLRYEDRNSMASSIESRVPFLTPDLVNFSMSLPEEFIIDGKGTSKAVFRAAMRGIVPDAILDRKDKIGFQTPERQWFHVLRPWITKKLNSDTAVRIPALRANAVNAEWRAFQEGGRDLDFRVWRWINLIEWARLFEVEFA